MKSTARVLSQSSGQTSQRTSGAVDASHEASVNVETAADAAETLLSATAEITRQLKHTTAVIETAATASQRDQRGDRPPGADRA